MLVCWLAWSAVRGRPEDDSGEDRAPADDIKERLALREGSLLSSVSRTHVYTAFAVIVVTIAVILGQLYPAERKSTSWSPTRS